MYLGTPPGYVPGCCDSTRKRDLFLATLIAKFYGDCETWWLQRYGHPFSSHANTGPGGHRKGETAALQAAAPRKVRLGRQLQSAPCAYATRITQAEAYSNIRGRGEEQGAGNRQPLNVSMTEAK